jgi:hypothetical protein
MGRDRQILRFQDSGVDERPRAGVGLRDEA